MESESWVRFVYWCKKADLKNATGTDASSFAKKIDSARITLRLTLVHMWNKAQRQKFNFHFSRVFF